MPDLIDREELLCALYQDCRCKNTLFLNCVRLARAVEAKPVRHGRWIKKPHEYGFSYHCSECDYIVDIPRPYCAICGTKMQEGENNAG